MRSSASAPVWTTCAPTPHSPATASRGMRCASPSRTTKARGLPARVTDVGDVVLQGAGIYQTRTVNSGATFVPAHWDLLNQQVQPGQGIGITVNGRDATVAIEGNSIDTAMLQDDAVTSAKIGAGAVTAAKIAANVLPTPRGAGTALRLDGNDLDLVLDVLRPAFPHQLVRTFVAVLDGTNDNFEVAISNDNTSGATRCGSAIGSSPNDDALLIEKDSATDGEILNGVEGGDWFFALRGDDRMVARIFCTDDDPVDSGVRRVWFNGDAAYKKGVDQYLQMGSGSGIVSFGAMGNVVYLRAALKTGTSPSLSADYETDARGLGRSLNRAPE